MYSVNQIHGDRVDGMDPGTRCRWQNPLSQRARCPAQRRRGSASGREIRLMQAGVDRTLIALWLGHESVETTQIYLDANLSLKEQALAKTTPVNAKTTGRYRPDDKLMAFLKDL